MITDLEGDLDAVINEVCAFYRGLGITPRVSHGFVAGVSEVLLPKLLARGFQNERFDEDYFVCSEPSLIQPVSDCKVRRVRELDSALRNFLKDEPWSLGVIERQLVREDYHLLVGRVDDLPVTIAALDIGSKVARVDDVLTHPDHRRRGYGRAVMHAFVNYHRQVSDSPLYLYASDPSALKIYHDAGFRKLNWKPSKWRAWLP